MPARVETLDGFACLAFEGMEDFLLEELRSRFGCAEAPQKYGSLFYFSKNTSCEPAWAKTVLHSGVRVSFSSISEAANSLRAVQRNWVSCPFEHFRRAALIQKKLPYINTKPRVFPYEVPESPVGLWTLADANTLLAFANSTSPFAGGNLTLIEDRENPPSRAYLKLQEALLRFARRFGVFPQKDERCFDAGASPGGWTWVLTQLGCRVVAVDRTELDSKLMTHPLVTFTEHDAFTLPPQELGTFDWIFSDVICYPERLLQWIRRCIASCEVKNIICTVKMQGKTDWKIINEFASIPGSFLQHLNYNKHELTWFYHNPS